jgi:metalloendopeptidase OMA1, mitochondrial
MQRFVNSPFTKYFLLIAILLLAGCRSVPYTGRKQMLFLPESQEIAMGQQAFAEVLATEQPSNDVRMSQIVERVGGRIAQVASKPEYQWEFRLLANQKQNAFCLPGGKVAVYDGIIPICHNEAGLAVVMSHEIAHAIARHGGERMSQEFRLKTLQGFLGYAFQDQSQASRDLILRAYGVGTNLGLVLPHSRRHELEADQIGVLLMARAGYDPNEAPRFWIRFGEYGKSSAPPEWMSTHPSDARRASDLQAMLPQAMNEYNMVPIRVGLGEQL